MLPQTYALPGALLLVLGGALACVAGHRLFKTVLAVYGFIFGALIASSVMGVSNTGGMVIGALLGGCIGAIVMSLAWFVGVAIVGAGMGALLAHLLWSQIGTSDPPALAVVIASVIGAVASTMLQRYVIIVGTAFGGAWTMLVGVLNAVAVSSGQAPIAEGVWIVYPLTPLAGARWVPVAWLVLGMFGTVVQLAITSRKK
jgi:uncharacterized protein DUF4203